MTIDTLAELEALLELCHKQNVHTIVIDGLTAQLTPRVPNVADEKDDTAFIDPLTGQPMSDEEIMFWHANRNSP